MSGNNPNQSNTIDFSHYQPNKKKTDGRKRQQQDGQGRSKSSKKAREETQEETQTRGRMTDKRDIELCLQYKHFRPDGVKWQNRKETWNKITEQVNKVDAHITKGCQTKTVQKRMQDLFDIHSYKFTEGYHNLSTGTSRPEVPADKDIERRVYDAWNIKQEDIQKSKEGKEKVAAEVEEKQRIMSDVKQQALEGFRAHKSGGSTEDEVEGNGKDDQEREATVIPDVSDSEGSSAMEPSFVDNDLESWREAAKKASEERRSDQNAMMECLNKLVKQSEESNRLLEKQNELLEQLIKNQK